MSPDPVPATRVARAMPAWATALVVLQSVTLLAALGGQPSPEAVAGQLRTGPAQAGDDDRQPGLPNAAEQRLQQIRLLGQIHETLLKTNQKLDQVNEQLKGKQPPEAPQP